MECGLEGRVNGLAGSELVMVLISVSFFFSVMQKTIELVLAVEQFTLLPNNQGIVKTNCITWCRHLITFCWCSMSQARVLAELLGSVLCDSRIHFILVSVAFIIRARHNRNGCCAAAGGLAF